MTTPTFGFVLPSSTGTDVPEPEAIWALARLADESSLDYLWVSDHIVWWHPMYDSLTLLAALAARTKRIRLGPAVLLLAMRNPVLVAKTLASIQRLSQGRLTVGVGIGGEFPPEWEAVGVKLSTRASRTDEMIEALKGLWGTGPFAYDGKHIEIRELDLHPKVDRPPIWIGGRSEGSIRRVAKHGEGWMGIFLTPDRYAQAVAKLKEETEAQGRDPEDIHPSLYVWTRIDDTTDDARAVARNILPGFYNVPYEKLERYAIVGSPEDCAARFKEFSDAGVRHFAVAPIVGAVSNDPLRRLIDQVLPLVRGESAG